MKILRLLLVVAAVGSFDKAPQPVPKPTQAPTRVYVAEFASRSIMDKALLNSFTDLFEAELIASGPYRVLNRRNLQKVLAEAQSESSIASMSDVPVQARSRIPAFEGAEGVVFGDVVDDADSGEISISVSLQSFDGVMHWTHSLSMKRGRLKDLASRREAMGTLVHDVIAAEAARVALSPASDVVVRLGQLAVSTDNRRVGLSVVIQNVTGKPLYLALPYHRQDGYGPQVDVTLADDRATRWSLSQIAGLNILPPEYPTPIRTDFTVIAPAQQRTLVLNFDKVMTNDQVSGTSVPGTTFSISIGGAYFTSSGLQHVSLGLTGMKPQMPDGGW